jgi:hypothetical protein
VNQARKIAQVDNLTPEKPIHASGKNRLQKSLKLVLTDDTKNGTIIVPKTRGGPRETE